ncbi:MAG: efflux RND transporter periplasmic adaptor subunit [Elusimicrobiales bacterium]|nr:efflux RND transporter periplasmic adaptor subunit [Elusimicrobiales bacterium]
MKFEFTKFFILFVFLNFIYSCSKETIVNEDVFYVRVEKVSRRDLRKEIILFGSIKGKDEAIIYPRISGKLVKNLVREGDYVKKDEFIALVKKDEVGSIYEPSPVPSTLGGYVGKVYQDEGSDVSPITPIALVVDQSSVRVQCDVPEKYISKIKIGQRVFIKVAAYKDRIFYGKINKVSPVLDKVSRTFLVESIFDNSNNLLRSGMSAEVHIIIEEINSAPTIPINSIVYRNNEPYVYLVDREKSIVNEIKAITGFDDGDYVWIKNLKLGDEVVVEGMNGLKNGSKIKIVE